MHWRCSAHHCLWKMANSSIPFCLHQILKELCCFYIWGFFPLSVYSPNLFILLQHEKASVIILGFVSTFSCGCASWVGTVSGDAAHPATHQSPGTPTDCALAVRGISIRSPTFSCLLTIFHSLGQIWWRGQFWDLGSFHTTFTWKLSTFMDLEGENRAVLLTSWESSDEDLCTLWECGDDQEREHIIFKRGIHLSY